MNPPVHPYVTRPQLVVLIEAGYLIDIVCMTAPRFKAAVWYGEWAVQVPEHRGEAERFLVSARGNDGPQLRTFKTGYGLISFMWKLGFRNITLPMEEGTSVPHRIGAESAVASPPASSTADKTAPAVLNDISTGLMHLSDHGFTSVKIATQLIEKGYAIPEKLEIYRGEVSPFLVDAVRLTEIGRLIRLMVPMYADDPPAAPADLIPDRERAITDYYVSEKADGGILVENIVCAKAWYTGQVEPIGWKYQKPTMKPPLVRRRIMKTTRC
ncbi:hypothetical protein ACG74X_20780 [Marivita sp. S0852]|uniref:hypothetical protein n=1 Tax=Marivita sp. S0852 TaxID=3373893 RepID=UPI003982005B